MAQLVLKGVKKRYARGVLAVKDFNLTVQDREFIVLVGPSGCGKTTVLRMIAGLEEISDGDFLMDGRRMNDVEPQNRDMAMVFQNYALYPHMSVYDNIAFSMKIRRVPKDEIDRRVKEAAKMLNLEALLARKPGEVSGGQRQRVAIGGAIVRRPKAFLMDEPLSNLDAKLRNHMRVELARLHRQLEATIVYVTHDQVEAMTLGDRIVVMNDGVVQQIDSPMALYDNPANLFVARFIGLPAMNLFDALASSDGLSFGFASSGKFLPAPSKYLESLRRRSIRRAVLGLRPEDVHGSWETPPAGANWWLSGERVEVVAREMLGASVVLHCRGERGNLALTADRGTPCVPGDTMSLLFDLDKLHVFDGESGERLAAEE